MQSHTRQGVTETIEQTKERLHITCRADGKRTALVLYTSRGRKTCDKNTKNFSHKKSTVCDKDS